MARTDAVEATTDVTPELELELEPTAADIVEAIAPVEEESTDGFTKAVEKALKKVGNEGTLTEAQTEAIRTEYQKLATIKAKNVAKKFLSDGTTKAVSEGNIAQAQALVTLTKEAAVPAKVVAVKKPFDPTESFVNHVASVYLAGFIAQTHAPEGLTITAEEAVAQAQAKAQELFAEASKITDGKSDNPVIRTALRTAEFKARRSAAGVRRDLGEHIRQAFQSVPVGTFLSVADVRKFVSTEYGDDRPSAGAVANRLNPENGKVTIEGIETAKNEGVTGAIRTA